MISEFNPAETSIENVYIFISDALRWSALPKSMRDRGLTFKTVASGCATMKSVSSIVSGVYPPTHGVVTWRDRLSLETLFDMPGLSSGFFDGAAGEYGGLSQVLGQESADTLDEIEPPFFYLERDAGGHAPYGEYTYDEMIREVEQTRSTLQSYYDREIEQSIERFDARLDLLTDRGLLDDTLVIFLGDHGELLGEYGLVSHTSPPVPELVYVPTIFIHPDLPTGLRPETIGHVDLAPTIRSVLDVSGPRRADDGVDLCSEQPGVRYNDAGHYLKLRGRRIPVYQAAGIWDGDGGHVFTRRGTFMGPILGYRKGQGWNRAYWQRNPKTIPAAIRRYLSRHTTYGAPNFSKSEADAVLAEIRDADATAERMQIEDEVQQQLEDLGYRT